ncbi:MAG: DNA polymerase III subunit delta [Flavobacteriales bacterium]|nr:DNA polymerase III subunit delta [Flavobacteriales bacterium]
MTHEQILADLKAKKYTTTYFLAGEETFYIDLICDYIEKNVLSESEKGFNQTVLYGRDVEITSLLASAKQFPMMAENTVIIVKEAQDLKKIDLLKSYVEQPLESTLLVLCYRGKKLDKRKALYKSVQKKGIYFESNKLYENKIPDWIKGYLRSKDYSISSKSAAMLTDFLGNDLSKISGELNKLCILTPKKSEITEELIEDNIGISKDYNNFELQNAIMNKDVFKANRILNYFEANPKNNPIVVTLSVLYNLFSKVLIYHGLKDKNPQTVAKSLGVNPYFVKDYQKAAQTYNLKNSVKALDTLREADMKSKGYNNPSTPHSDLLKEVIYKLCHS